MKQHQLLCNNFGTSWCVSITSLRPRLNDCNPVGTSSTETATRFKGGLGHTHSEKKWSRFTLLEFNVWLNEKTGAHEKMKVNSAKPKADENSHSTTRSRTAPKVFASTFKADARKFRGGFLPTKAVSYIDCKELQPLWRCPVFRQKTPTQIPKIVADNKLCFSCLYGMHSFRQCTKPRKCTPESSHKVVLHGTERIIPPRPLPKQTNATKSTNVPVKKQSGENLGVVSQPNFEGLPHF